MRLVIVLLILIPSLLVAQNNPFADVFPIVNERVTYSEVINVDGKTKSDLFRNAKIGLTNIFKSSKDVIQNEDNENHIIIAKGFFDIQGHNISVENAKLWFTVRIDCRDERYKYTITDFIYDFYITDLAAMYTTIYTKKVHYSRDFTEWGNVSYDTKFINLLNKKFPPDKPRNDKQQEKYEKYKEKLDEELSLQNKQIADRYTIIDSKIKSIIGLLKKEMEQSDDNW